MTPDDNDPLLRQLLEIVRELDAENIPIILGGGMNRYLSQKYMSSRMPRYPFDLATRSTNDLDIFLSSGLIVDAGRMERLRLVIERLHYKVIPKAKNFQFAKEVDLYGQKQTVKIDLLAAPPQDADRAKVDISKPRIKPKGAKDIHAYLTDEAKGIEIGKLAVDIGLLDPELKLKHEILFLPSAFNTLILKLHAFADRKDREDSDFGRHHALDIFATVARMNERDWKIAQGHLASHRGQDYLTEALRIRKENFSQRSDIGSIRLQENESYQQNRRIYDQYLEFFIKDLVDLFPD